ncbi:MPT-synthase sulfurylase [Balamuthia mandrillaris]
MEGVVEELYQDYKRQHFADVEDLSVADLLALQEKDEPRKAAVVLVDVREDNERAVSMLPCAVTEEQFWGWMKAKENEREQEKEGEEVIVVPYCTIGYRSGLFARYLHQRFAQDGRRKGGEDERGERARRTSVKNLRGSLLAWTHEQQPLVTPEGNPTTRVHTFGKEWALVPPNYSAIYATGVARWGLNAKTALRTARWAIVSSRSSSFFS